MMSKDIVICMDGTWNDPSEKTNVYKLFQSLNAGSEQYVRPSLTTGGYALRRGNNMVAFYLEGVGASGRDEHWLGGATGFGLRTRVLHAFILASASYEPGDKLWVFGFSRGAWSARSLAGMIGRVGLLRQHDTSTDDADFIANRLWLLNKLASGAKRGDEFWKDDPAPIKLVGVWDTVGALGIPWFNGIKAVDQAEKRLLDFADLNLHARVEHGRHALAIDEHRFDFTPTVWNARKDGTVKQVWFSGGHADVGGGYPDAGLSDIALQWMGQEIKDIDNAFPCDLAALDPKVAPNCKQPRHDESRKPIWQTRPVVPRHIPQDALLHATVIERLGSLQGYRPAAVAQLDQIKTLLANVELNWAAGDDSDILDTGAQAPAAKLGKGESKTGLVHAARWWNSMQLQVTAGERYRVTAAGEWWDEDNRCSWTGYKSPNLVLSAAERTRRAPKADWFSLIGAVNPSDGLESNNPTAKHLVTGMFQCLKNSVSEIDQGSELFNVSKGDIRVTKSGYLYLFANDSAFAYANNHGALQATVTRVE